MTDVRQVRGQAQHAARHETIARIVAEGECLAKRLDEDAGRAQRGRKSTDHRAHLRFSEEVEVPGLSRILKPDFNADR